MRPHEIRATHAALEGRVTPPRKVTHKAVIDIVKQCISKKLDLTFHILQHTFSKVSVLFFFLTILNTIEIPRDLGET